MKLILALLPTLLAVAPGWAQTNPTWQEYYDFLTGPGIEKLNNACTLAKMTNSQGSSYFDKKREDFVVKEAAKLGSSESDIRLALRVTQAAMKKTCPDAW